MIDFTHEDIERLWDSVVHYVPERQKLDMAIDFIKSLEDIGVEIDEIKASAEYDSKLEEAINTVFEEDEEELTVHSADRWDDIPTWEEAISTMLKNGRGNSKGGRSSGDSKGSRRPRRGRRSNKRD